MTLSCLIYLSEATPAEEFDGGKLQKHCDVWNANNTRNGVSGYICYFKGRFIQYIEAPQESIDILYRSIESNPLHKVLFHISNHELEQKRFPGWGMKVISDDELNQFNIELLVENNLLYLKNKLPNPEKAIANIWQQMDSIARASR